MKSKIVSSVLLLSLVLKSYSIAKKKISIYRNVDLKSTSVKVDLLFLKKLVIILKRCCTSRSVFILTLHSLCLINRSLLTLYVAKIDGKIVRHMVSGNLPAFLRSVLLFLLIGLPSVFTNSMIRRLQSLLTINLRSNFVKYIHQKYLHNNTFYKVLNLDSRITNCDQLITNDVQKFCSGLSNLYSNLGKPSLDFIIL